MHDLPTTIPPTVATPASAATSALLADAARMSADLHADERWARIGLSDRPDVSFGYVDEVRQYAGNPAATTPPMAKPGVTVEMARERVVFGELSDGTMALVRQQQTRWNAPNEFGLSVHGMEHREVFLETVTPETLRRVQFSTQDPNTYGDGEAAAASALESVAYYMREKLPTPSTYLATLRDALGIPADAVWPRSHDERRRALREAAAPGLINSRGLVDQALLNQAPARSALPSAPPRNATARTRSL